MKKKPRILIAQANFYEDVADMLLDGATAELKDAGASFKTVTVPGALEIPAAIKLAAETGEFDAYVALGCVIRGKTSHYDIVAGESARALMDLGIYYNLPIGNGILTCENMKQAYERADSGRLNKGAGAAQAALALLDIQKDILS